MGESVRATTPETSTAPAKCERELAEESAGQAALDGDGCVDGRQRDRHRDDRADQLAGALERRLEWRLAGVEMPLHVLHHHDRVVHDEPHREDDGEKRQEVDREARRHHQEYRAHEGDRDGHDGDDHGARRAQEEEDHHDDDEQRLGQGLQDLVDGVLDVQGRVVGDPDVHARGELRPDVGNGLADLADHVEGVGGGEDPDAHEGGGLAVEPHVLVVVLRAEDHVGDLAEAHDDAVLLLDDELAELLGGLEVGIGDQVHRDHRALGPAQGREVVVLRQRVAHLGRGDAEGRHLARLQPDAHGERPVAEDLGPLDAADGRELRLDDPRQVVGDLVLVEMVGGEADVHRGELVVGRLHLDDRSLGLGGEVVADLRHLRLDLGQGRVRVVVELQVDGDGAQGLGARRLHVVDPVGARDDPFEGSRDEAPDEVGVGADVRGRHPDHGDVAARILADAQGADGLQARDEDDEVDDDREDRSPDEEVGELHQLSSGRGAASLPGWTSLFTCTAPPLRSLNTPEVTTSSPGLTPDTTATRSPRAPPSFTNSWRTPR